MFLQAVFILVALECQISEAAVAVQKIFMETECAVIQEIELRYNPVLHFFSSKEHTRATLDCSEGPTFELDPADKSDSYRLEPLEPQIQTQLIDSQLYNPEVVTYFITHGYLESWDLALGNYPCLTKDLILNNSEANVFILDWSGGSRPPIPIDYSYSVAASKVVGELLGSFINSLIRVTDVQDASRYHLYSHSLGSHLVGTAGYVVPEVGRITVADPAGGCFLSPEEERAEVRRTGRLPRGRRRLSQQSAKLVVAIHTDSKLLGLSENVGHYDIYANGGVKQPECLTQLKPPRPTLDPSDQIACNHAYSHRLIDTFAVFLYGDSASEPKGAKGLDSNLLGQPPITDQAEADRRCYEVAYRCSTYEAFESGECGVCFDDDESDCLYIGLSFKTYDSAPKVDYTDEGANSNNVDGGNSNKNSIPIIGRLPSLGENSEKNQIGEHFVKSGMSDPLVCQFHYQVIIAAKKSDSDLKLYLQIPLRESGKLEGSVGEQDDRLIEASHKLADGSDAAESIRKELPKYAGDIEVEEVDLYTALITFDLVKCDGASESSLLIGDQWKLCEPLDNIEEGLLLGSSEEAAESIQWATLIYMSGVEARSRLKFSYVFERDNYESAEPQTCDKSGFKVFASKLRQV